MNRPTDKEKSQVNSLSLAFVEQLYLDYLHDPSSVSADWRRYFEQFSNGDLPDGNVRLGPSFQAFSIFNPPGQDGAKDVGEAEVAALQDRVDELIRNYRVRGHMVARIDPLSRPRPSPAELDPKFYGFTEADMDRRFSCETIQCDGPLKLREILERLRNTYCRSIGAQFMHIDDLSVRRWLQERMEGTENRLNLTREEQIRILTRLTDAVIFEEFIRKKFIGAKSFSLEGAESLIPLLDLAIEKGGEDGLDEIVLAMAHRGRLNVLANIIGKSPRDIFREFEDPEQELRVPRGDVKYHLGYSNDWKISSGRKVHLSLCFNPSHLEFVNPVAVGRMRAKQDRVGDIGRNRGMVLLIHGDASFAGEGVVQETLNLSQLEAYSVGGTLHVIVNNQIGFTTSPDEYRSSTYTTDVAKMLQISIFHVNGEDPEAVAQVVRLSMDFRRTFKRDVVIDMYCYRRLGHNEGDEPTFTQPVLYRAIAKRKPVREGYLEHLLQLGGVTREEADGIAARRRELLEKELSEARNEKYIPRSQTLGGIWSGYYGGRESEAEEVNTGVKQERLSDLLEIQTRFPEDFHPHPKIERGVRVRREMAQGKRPLDWSGAEALAFASLAVEGIRVRLTGQDTARGTFSQRHAVLYDFEDGHTYTPLQHLSPDQAPVEIYNSPLSELGALGFEYGYSLDFPDGLVLWEAQFGDFSNAAQVIIDQFMTSAEEKWSRLSGIVLLLPHGFEGMGPEHSSARLERFLQLAANDNIQVVYPTTPAQYFHCLRRQALRRWRKPLVVMTPKSLLRHPRVVSSLEECAKGTFQRVIRDPRRNEAERFERVILCSGKIYYELEQQRDRVGRNDVAILRIEQLYPLPEEILRLVLASYPDGTPVFWVQEEPENMGAWHYLQAKFGEKLFNRLPFAVVSRPESASPATGSGSSHKREQEQLLAAALGDG
ncbi:MAG TPA: 2-oxoglutarate dehydrogenase E1 component [Candidatus Binatia bacterium]|jgi:2-oxoglutarate dehydrogenase E1 component|nr:2-oxoglutarate dehydrogenase E1 component [Candidatus Binatia bacterium]